MAIRRVTAEQFKKAVAEKSDLNGLVAIKGVAADVKQEAGDEGDRILTFTISTADVDRDGDTIDPNGWELDNFIKGGSMLWGHNPNKVIAAPLATWIENGKLRSRARFPSKEESAFAFEMYQLFRGGFVRGTSVGFVPKEWKESNRDGGGERWYHYPTDFLRQELLEYSGTPIPSNPNALMDAKSKGIDFKSFIPLVEPIMDGESNLFLPRELAEQIYNTAKDASPTYSLPSVEDKTVIPFKHFALAPKEESWDGPKEIAASDVDTLKLICTWYDGENADVKSSYKLPHHRSADKNTVWSGVTAAMGALLGARGGVDIPEGDRQRVYNHLARHYREFDEEPPEFKAVDQVEAPKTATDILSNISGQLDKACKMISANGTKLLDDVRALLAVSEKALSDANLQTLRDVRDALSLVIDGKDVDDDDDSDVLDLGTRDVDDGIEIDREAIGEAVKLAIENQVTESIRRAMGRVD